MNDKARAEAERRWPQQRYTVQEPILLESTARVAFVEGAEWGVAEGIRQAREAVEAARPTTYDLNWAWQAIDRLTS